MPNLFYSITSQLCVRCSTEKKYTNNCVYGRKYKKWQPCILKLTCAVGWLHLVIFIFIFKALSKLLLLHTSCRPSIKAQLYQSVHDRNRKYLVTLEVERAWFYASPSLCELVGCELEPSLRAFLSEQNRLDFPAPTYIFEKIILVHFY